MRHKPNESSVFGEFGIRLIRSSSPLPKLNDALAWATAPSGPKRRDYTPDRQGPTCIDLGNSKSIKEPSLDPAIRQIHK